MAAVELECVECSQLVVRFNLKQLKNSSFFSKKNLNQTAIILKLSINLGQVEREWLAARDERRNELREEFSKSLVIFYYVTLSYTRERTAAIKWWWSSWQLENVKRKTTKKIKISCNSNEGSEICERLLSDSFASFNDSSIYSKFSNWIKKMR